MRGAYVQYQVQGGHAHQLGLVVDTGRLEDLSGNRNCRVDGVADNVDHSLHPP